MTSQTLTSALDAAYTDSQAFAKRLPVAQLWPGAAEVNLCLHRVPTAELKTAAHTKIQIVSNSNQITVERI